MTEIPKYIYFLSQHLLDIVLSSHMESVNNVNVCEPLGCSGHSGNI